MDSKLCRLVCGLSPTHPSPHHPYPWLKSARVLSAVFPGKPFVLCQALVELFPSCLIFCCVLGAVSAAGFAWASTFFSALLVLQSGGLMLTRVLHRRGKEAPLEDA
jgi:hypothetical protein